MRTTTHYILFIALLFGLQLSAQEENNSERIRDLKEQREKITNQERSYLKIEVEAINIRLSEGEITKEEADKLKREVAEKRALNIENRTAIIDNKIALLERNKEGYKPNDGDESIAGIRISDEGTFIGINVRGENKPIKYDKRTTSAFVIAFGLNNAIIEGEKLDDSPYKFWGSHFFETGWAWKTRLFKNSNAVRIKYGFSFQFNGLKPTDNRYFVQDEDETSLEEFPYNLDKAKLNVTNFVIPIHFEFGPSKKIEKSTHFRYSTKHQFRFGIGGYFGLKTGVYQKLKYRVDGDKVKEKLKLNYNTYNLLYGVSSYIAYGGTSLYAKYDLTPMFRNQVVEQRNISLGIRFDLD